MDHATIALSARDVDKHFGKLAALRGVTLGLPVGSFTALVGPNGAGKSTLMKAWVGFERPSSGSVAVDGVDPWRDRRGALARIAYVPQSPSLYRDLSVLDHVDMAVACRPGFDRAVAVRRLDDLGIPRQAVARRLSGGQAAQVGLSLALGTRAPVLVLDEPLASLDPLARTEFLRVLASDVRERAATVVMSSHVVSDIERWCDRLVVLAAGRVLVDGGIASVTGRHRMVPPGEAAGSIVAEVATGADGTMALVADGHAQVGPSRPATLEEVVLGYLSAAKAGVD
ncbi:MAG: ABC transporter ATP-binding protein [Chloroflexota bacterium]